MFDNIKIEQILESKSNQEYDDDKFNPLDILTQNSKNKLIIIEIQSTYEIDYFASSVRHRWSQEFTGIFADLSYMNLQAKQENL